MMKQTPYGICTNETIALQQQAACNNLGVRPASYATWAQNETKKKTKTIVTATTNLHASIRPGVEAQLCGVGGPNQLGGALAQHDGGGVGVARRQRRKDRCVCHAQTSNAARA